MNHMPHDPENPADDRNARLVAFEVQDSSDFPIRPASRTRDWMDATTGRFAYRCLPLVIANQAGWCIHSPCDFTARWNGGPHASDVSVTFAEGLTETRAFGHFGVGVLTFSLPYLFRTPPGVNLWVKGPSNHVKDGIQALEGIVETDWAVAPFTMNWKFTRPNHDVRFEREEPICMLVPMPRPLIESLRPILTPIASDPETEARFDAWTTSRTVFIEGLTTDSPEYVRRGWERDYMLGRDSNKRTFAEHQTRLDVRPFERE